MSKQPPRVQLNFEPDEIPEQVSMQVNDYDEDVIDHLHDDELQMPDIVGKPEVKENDIFDDIPDKETGEKNPNFIYEDKPPAKQPVKKEKVKKPRKPMSEEHKQKLALAREKAMAVRKAKAEERRNMKALDNQEKDIDILKEESPFSTESTAMGLIVDENSVENYFNISRDREIPNSDLCQGISKLKEKNIYLGLDIKCEDIQDGEVNIYQTLVTDEDIEDCE